MWHSMKITWSTWARKENDDIDSGGDVTANRARSVSDARRFLAHWWCGACFYGIDGIARDVVAQSLLQIALQTQANIQEKRRGARWCNRVWTGADNAVIAMRGSFEESEQPPPGSVHLFINRSLLKKKSRDEVADLILRCLIDTRHNRVQARISTKNHLRTIHRWEVAMSMWMMFSGLMMDVCNLRVLI